jgi:hypothetical protein
MKMEIKTTQNLNPVTVPFYHVDVGGFFVVHGSLKLHVKTRDSNDCNNVWCYADHTYYTFTADTPVTPIKNITIELPPGLNEVHI